MNVSQVHYLTKHSWGMYYITRISTSVYITILMCKIRETVTIYTQGKKRSILARDIGRGKYNSMSCPSSVLSNEKFPGFTGN